MVLLIIPKTLLALLHAATHCCELFISLDIIIPKSFSIKTLSNIFTIHFVTELIIIITCVHYFAFSHINSIFHFWAHEVNLFKSVCNIPLSFSSITLSLYPCPHGTFWPWTWDVLVGGTFWLEDVLTNNTGTFWPVTHTPHVAILYMKGQYM